MTDRPSSFPLCFLFGGPTNFRVANRVKTLIISWRGDRQRLPNKSLVHTSPGHSNDSKVHSVSLQCDPTSVSTAPQLPSLCDGGSTRECDPDRGSPQGHGSLSPGCFALHTLCLMVITSPRVFILWRFLPCHWESLDSVGSLIWSPGRPSSLSQWAQFCPHPHTLESFDF